MKRYKVGIIGATGVVGQRFISLLKNHPWFKIEVLAASEKSSQKKYKEAVKNRWTNEEEIPEELKDLIVLNAVDDIKKITRAADFVFCAVNMKKEEIKNLEEAYAKLECPVISNNSAHRFTSDVPMIIPEVNANHTEIIEYQKKRLKTKKGFIAVKSNCSIQCFVPALHPLVDLRLKNVLVCTYQAISGAGKDFKSWPQMTDNIIPYIKGEEEKSELEPLKIWGSISRGEIISAKSPNITTQCLRVPVTDGHTAAVFTSFENNNISMDKIIKRWNDFKGDPKSIGLPSSPKKLIHYFHEDCRPQISLDRNLEQGMGFAVGRLRKDSQYDIKFVCMSHNTIRGAAGGAVLMAELLCTQGYI